jgi:hypothetical protein
MGGMWNEAHLRRSIALGGFELRRSCLDGEGLVWKWKDVYIETSAVCGVSLEYFILCVSLHLLL